MIDFRYHLVSIVAVFLALAIGIVIGATALKPAVTSTLAREAKAEARRNKSLYAHNTQLKREIAADESFAAAAEGRLLPGLLTGQSVVLVLAPNTDSATVAGVTTALREAGATLTGQVVLTSQFFDTTAANEQTMAAAAKSLAPAGLVPPKSTPDPQISGQQAVAQVLAETIAARDGLATLTQAELNKVLAGFASGQYLQVKGASGSTRLNGQASLAVVMIPQTVPPAKVSDPFNRALVWLTQDLAETTRPTLMAGPLLGSGPRSAIEAVTSGSAGVALTTVDNAETKFGQIIVAQALRKLLEPGTQPTAYGVRPGTVPSPAPSPSVSPSSTPSSSSRPKKAVK
ncbi:MAG TPA: copper transporter [Streptosporangiaceae bacterium]